MANEFKIKKGLIVTGASGGTVVDIQGSQGQLFSVTDDLSGSIFAVSDISGVPILDVNSSGLSTFSDNVVIGSVDSVVTGLNIGEASPTIQLFDTTNDGKLLMYMQDSSAVVGTYSNHSLNLFSDSTLALTIDTSQNAIFTGSLDVNGTGINTFTGNILIDNAAPIIQTNSSNNASGLRINVTGIADSTNNLLRVQRSGTTMIDTRGNGNTTFTAQAFSAATSSGDGSSTLTTKGYVDSLITGATIYRGTWDPDVSLNSGYGNPNLNTVTQTSGYYYICSADGAATPNGTGNEPDSWNTGDWVIWNDDIGASGEWQKIDNSSVLSGVGTGQTVALWQGASSVTDSETLGNAPITVSGNDTTFAGTVLSNTQLKAITSSGGVSGYFTDAVNSTLQIKHASGQLQFLNGSNNVWLIEDGSKNTTFAGNTSAPKFIAAQDTTYANGYQLTRTGHDTYRICLGNSEGLRIVNETDSNREELTFDGAGNATFAGNVTASNFYGLAQDLAVTSNDTFSGTYSLLWHSGADVYSSTWMTVTGSNDTLTVPTIAADLNGTINTATTGTTQTAGNNSTLIATTAYADAAAGAVPIGDYLPLSAGSSYPLTGVLHAGQGVKFTGGTIAAATTVLHTNNVVYARGGSSGMFLQNADGSDGMFIANDHIRLETGSAERMRITSAGNVGIGETAPATKLEVAGGIIGSLARISTTKRYPMGHYTPGETIFEIDPTWDTGQLQTYFNSTNVTWTADADAPGGYAITITGQVGVGGVYGSGFPYIPVDNDGVYYVECYIKNVGTGQTHYMGGNEFDENFASTGGNPGSYAYFVMSNTNPGNTWTKVSGYIGGFDANTTGKFELATKYWTPLALFNWGAGTGTRACVISGWKVIRADSPGDRYFDGNVGIGTTSPLTKLHIAGTTDANIIRIENTVTALSSGDTIGAIQFFNNDTTDDSPNVAASIYATAGASGGSGSLRFKTIEPGVEGDPATEAMIITNSGNVGIGTNNPAQDFVVADATNGNGIELVPGATATIQTYNRGTSSYNNLNIDTARAQIRSFTYTTINTGSALTERMRITSAGGISFGSTGTAYGTSGQVLTSAGNASPTWTTPTTGTVTGGGSNTYLAKWTTATNINNSAMFQAASGNFSIGITTPNAKLSVVNDISIGTSATDVLRLSNISGVGGIYGFSSRDLAFGSITNGEVMRVDNTNERVGIGMTTPYTKLVIGSRGTAAAPSILAYDGIAFDFYNDSTPYKRHGVIISQAADASESVLDFNTKAASGTNSTKMTILGNGNVGIGTDSPQQKLQVASPSSTSVVLGASYSSSNNSNFFETGINANDGYINLRNSGVSTTVHIDSDGVSYLNGGNVGIGTTSPNDGDLTINAPTLHVVGPGTAGAYNLVARFQAGNDSDNTGSAILINHSNDRGLLIKAGRKDGDREVAYFDVVSSGANVTNMLTMGKFDSNYNVGIGTTTPNAKLDIQGTQGQLFSVTDNLSGSIFAVSDISGVPIFDVNSSGVSTFAGTVTAASGTFSNLTSTKFPVAGTGGLLENSILYKLNYNAIGLDTTGRQFFGNNFHTISNAVALNLHAGLTSSVNLKGNGADILVASTGGNVNIPNGKLGIGMTTAPSYELDVAGTIRATGDVIAYSDVRVKENIKTIDNSLEKVSKLRGVEFNKIGDNEKSIGVIAQEIEKVIPEVVKEDDKGMKSVAYGNISGLLIEAIKELKAEIEELKLNKCNCNK